LEFEEQVNDWNLNYQKISDKVDAFEKVSDPETIRHYVKALNDILDDINYLDELIDTGQISSNSLDKFFVNYQRQVDDINDRILLLHLELTELDSTFKGQVYQLTGETEDNFELIEDKIQEQIDYVNKLNVDIGQSVKQLEGDVQTIKSSKYGNKIWEIKNKGK
jgi:methyl-accepting chemotaxis protein